MNNDQRWRLFNLDSLIAELDSPTLDASSIDVCVAALSYKNFDFIERRLPFVFESVTYNLQVWRALLAAAPLKYWIKSSQEGVLLYPQTEHCGYLRSYRYRGGMYAVKELSSEWVTVANPQALYDLLNTAAARSVYDRWSQWVTIYTNDATCLADGRYKNTTVSRSIILSSLGNCLACSAPAIASARTTISCISGNGTLIQLALCAEHLEQAKSQPSVLKFLGTLFSLSIDIPQFERTEAIPDDLIPHLHAMVAEELGGKAAKVEKRENGWHLKVELPNGWWWLLRLNSLMDYSYMLLSPDEKKQIYRADSAPHHRELPFFPDHEHSHPDKKKDIHSPSFLYGNPFFDFKRLRDIGEEYMRKY